MGLSKGTILAFLLAIVSVSIFCAAFYERDFSIKVFSLSTFENVTLRNGFDLNTNQGQTGASPADPLPAGELQANINSVSDPEDTPVSRIQLMDEITGNESDPDNKALSEISDLAAEKQLDVGMETAKATASMALVAETGDAANGTDKVTEFKLGESGDKDGRSGVPAKQDSELNALNDVDPKIALNETARRGGGVGDGGVGDNIPVPEESLAPGTKDLTTTTNDLTTKPTVHIENGMTNISEQSLRLEAYNLSSARVKTQSNNTWMTVSSLGRLGNQMFQYAALYGITRSNSTWRPYITINGFRHLKSLFGESLTLPVKTPKPCNRSEIRENNDADIMIKRLKTLPVKNISLNGFFQSHKFFGRYSREIRREFTFSSTEQGNVRRYFTEITPPEWNRTTFTRVGIQVRRRNMVTSRRQRMGVIPSTPEYFQRAMDYFNSRYDKVQFIVASDDMTWCKTNIRGPKVIYSVHGYKTDLAMLAMCDHVIISVGTYSWWAGWLCKGITIYHGAMPRNGSYMAKMYANNKWVPPDDEFQEWRPVT